MSRLDNQQLLARSGISQANEGGETLAITRAESLNSGANHWVVVWCPHCGTSRKDPDLLVPGLPAFTCKCGATFTETEPEPSIIAGASAGWE